MNVLILTDLSPVAKNAGEFALHFLRDTPVKFHLLNIGQFHTNRDPQLTGSEKMAQAMEIVDKRIGELRKITKNPNHHFEGLYSENDLVTATRHYTDSRKIDLIVMGAASKGFSPHTIVGNQTYEILQKVKCNLLAVAEGSKFREIEKVIFPYTYYPSLDENIKKLQNFPAFKKNVEINVMEIFGPSYEEEPENPAGSTLVATTTPGKVKHLKVRDLEIFSISHLQKLQEDFDLITLMGRDITLCYKLLHNKYGIFSTISGKLPIFVLHD
ncbi:MAG: universal stress protein [Gillisia sp.]